MDTLPPELLRQISWLALNPEFYLTSKTIKSKLPPLYQFLSDIGMLLFCQWDGPVWGGVDPLPWRTFEASNCDNRISIETRRDLQRIVLNQSWFSLAMFKSIIIELSMTWIQINYTLTNLEFYKIDALEQYLVTDMTTGFSASFDDTYGNTLICYGIGCFAIKHRDEGVPSMKRVMDVLYYPPKLFDDCGPPSKVQFFSLLQHFTDEGYNVNDLFYSRSSLKQAVLNAARENEEEWFAYVFDHAVVHGVDISPDQLFHDVYTVAIREGNWAIVSTLCEGIRLPEGFFDWKLKPDLIRAISNGDSAAKEFLDRVERLGWSLIQSQKNLDIGHEFKWIG